MIAGLKFFSTFYPLIIVPLGLIGNILTYIIFGRKRLKNISVSIFFRYMSVTNSLCLIQYMQHYLKYNDIINLRTLSFLSCKISYFCILFLGPTSAWVLCYVSIERFITIQYPRKSLIIKKKFFQRSIIFTILVISFVVYSPYLFFLETITPNDGKNKTFCKCVNQIYDILTFIDFAYSTLIPFLIMFIFSLLIIYSFIKSKNRIAVLFASVDRKRVSRDRKFCITILILNFIFLILNCPDALMNYIDYDEDDILPILSNALFYTYFAIDFLIYIFVNSIFRNEFLDCFKSFSYNNSKSLSTTKNYHITTKKIIHS